MLLETRRRIRELLYNEAPDHDAIRDVLTELLGELNRSVTIETTRDGHPPLFGYRITDGLRLVDEQSARGGYYIEEDARNAAAASLTAYMRRWTRHTVARDGTVQPRKDQP